MCMRKDKCKPAIKKFKAIQEYVAKNENYNWEVGMDLPDGFEYADEEVMDGAY